MVPFVFFTNKNKIKTSDLDRSKCRNLVDYLDTSRDDRKEATGEFSGLTEGILYLTGHKQKRKQAYEYLFAYFKQRTTEKTEGPIRTPDGLTQLFEHQLYWTRCSQALCLASLAGLIAMFCCAPVGVIVANTLAIILPVIFAITLVLSMTYMLERSSLKSCLNDAALPASTATLGGSVLA